ncbi:MAG: fibronectin type III domain-containing protein [Phycisphaerales bacterium]|nr:MAG: fibronectin type III domain-containing protein [Phycisphaerales bacterium]
MILLTGCVAASAGESIRCPVIVHEPAGIDRRSEPVSGGISLPQGVFRPGAVKLALFDGDRAVPVQVSELVVGPGGWVRWILLDFQLDLDASEVKTLSLQNGDPRVPDQGLKVTEDNDVITIYTGAMTIRINKIGQSGPIEKVSVDGRDRVVGSRISYKDGLSGRSYLAAGPTEVNLHYQGPLRVTVELRGGFQDSVDAGMYYCTYVTAWFGRTDILVRHSLINSHPDRRSHVKIAESSITLDLSEAKDVIVGAERPMSFSNGGDINLHQGLEQQRNRDMVSVRLTKGDHTVWSGRDTGGWLAAGGVWVADRLFGVDPPRSLSVSRNDQLVLNAAPALFDGRSTNNNVVGRPYACQDQYRWLYDCSHHSSEYRLDFDAEDDADRLNKKARAAAARVWAFGPGWWYSQCEVLGTGRFGTLEDERTCHKTWGWKVGPEQDMRANPNRFVDWEDNHYESEADSAEGLLLMFLRTGKRGFLDEAEGWVRYHTDLQTWRTENWQWKDGGIWFPQGGPPGNRPMRDKAVAEYERWNKGTNADRTLWRLSMAKECYCHFYGAGLVDWYCLTGDCEALAAAIDSCETKWDEFTHFRNFTPGESSLASTRGFGRGFYVAVRTWMVRPQDQMLAKLVTLCRDTFVKLPEWYLDERGIYAPIVEKRPDRYLTEGIKRYMKNDGIEVDDKGVFRDKQGSEWPWRDIGGTWMIAYITAACNLLAEQTGDEDLMDYVIASGRFTAKYMQSPVAHQTWYYTALDIPRKGDIWDGWKYDGLKRNELGEGPKHSGWYTRFFPDCCAQAYTWTGDESLLERGRQFWSFGNRRLYQTTHLTPQHHFATHRPPKDDSVLSTVKLFYESSHPRPDSQPPRAVTDLSVSLSGANSAEVRFTAPADPGGRVTRYQVKAAELPILPYEQWDCRRHAGTHRNWWRAANCHGEPTPREPGAEEEFAVSNVPDGAVYFAVRSYDDQGNQSAISNVAKAK